MRSLLFFLLFALSGTFSFSADYSKGFLPVIPQPVSVEIGDGEYRCKEKNTLFYYTQDARESANSVAFLRKYLSEYYNMALQNVGRRAKADICFNIIPDRMLRIYVFGGPTFEVGLKSADKLSVAGIGEISYNYYTGKFSSSSDEITDIVASSGLFPDQKVYGRFDVMVGGGVGIQVIRFLDIKVGYDYGLVNRYRKEMDKTVNRGQFYVGVGVRI